MEMVRDVKEPFNHGSPELYTVQIGSRRSDFFASGRGASTDWALEVGSSGLASSRESGFSTNWLAQNPFTCKNPC